MTNKGFLLVIDGIDGSGKTTQIELLKKYLEQKNIPFKVISFPQYGKNEYADKIRDYLSGKLGQMEVHDLAKIYAEDRKTVRDLIKEWLASGKLVIANRYVSSSKAHLGANLEEDERGEFISWVDKLEYEENGMPRPNLTILLNVDPKVGQQNTLRDHQIDIHEQSIGHQQKASKIFFELPQTEENWMVLDCMNKDQMKSKEDIHQQLVKIILAKLPS